MTTKNLIPRASGEGGIGIDDVTWGHGYYDTGNFNKGLFVSGYNITQVIAETVTQGGLGGEWERNGLDIYYNSGNVGIGVSNPAEPLRVSSVGPNGRIMGFANSGGAKLNARLMSHDNGSNYVDTKISFDMVSTDGTAYEPALTLKAGGNVGIGTTNPGTALDIKGSVRIQRDGSSPLLQFTDTGVGSRWMGLVDGTSRFAIYGTDGTTEQFVIDSSGKVGIGLANPGRLLHLNYDSALVYDSSQMDRVDVNIYSRNTNNAIGSYSAIDFVAGVSSAIIAGVRTSTGASALTFGTTIASQDHTSEKMRIDSAGNVGIGTASPGAELDVNGVGRFLAPNGGSALCSFAVGATTAENQPVFALVTNETNNEDRVRFNSDGHSWFNGGNVGIGTRDPGSKFVVQGDNADIYLKSADGTASVSLIQDPNGYGKLDVMNNVGNVICHFDSNGSSYIKNGNVGIGLILPAAKLDILKGGGTQYDAVDDVFQNLSPEHALKLSTGGWRNASVINQQTGSTAGLTLSSTGLYLNSAYGAKPFSSSSIHVNCDTGNGDISFLTGNGDTVPTTKIKIQNNGNVGIGTSSPAMDLDVVGKVYFSKIPCSNNLVPASNFIGAAMSFQPASGTFGTGKPKDIGIAWQSLHGAGGNGKGETDLVLGTINPQGSNQEIMKLHSDGSVRIGRKSSENYPALQRFWGALLPGGSLEIRAEENVNAADAQLRIVGGNGLNTGQAVTGSLYIDNGGSTTVGKFKISQDIFGGEIHVTSSSGGVKLASGGTTWAPATSDRRAKENISPLENVLEKVLKLSPSRFDFKEEYGNKDQIGFIAQDVNEVLPEFHIPGETEEEMSTVKFSDTATTALLVKAIQEQQQIIEDLKSRIETLENK